VFVPDNSNPNSIIGQSVLSLFEDKNGIIWIGTNKGLSKYNPRLDQFTNYRHDKKNPRSLSYGVVFSIYQDRSGDLWIGTLNGLNKHNPETNDFIQVENIVSEKNTAGFRSVTCFEEDHLGNLWIGTWKGITCFRNNGSKQYISLPKNNIKVHMNSEVCAIVEDHENNLWIGTKLRGVFKYNPVNGTFINYLHSPGVQGSVSGNSVRCIFRDSENNIWIGTKTGLSKYDFTANTFINYTNDPDKPLSISSNNILSIAEDKTGMVWVGTMEGLSSFYQADNFFNFITVDDDPDNRIHSVIKDFSDNIWTGSRKGIFKIAAGSKEVVPFKSKDKGINSFIFKLMPDEDGTIWIGSTLGGLNRLDPLTGTITSYRMRENDPASISSNSVLNFCTDKKGNMWIGTWQGAEKFDIKSGRFTKLKGIKNDITWNVLCDSKGTIWISSTGNGLYNYDPNTKKILHFSADAGSKLKIISNRVISLLESGDGIIWIGTSDGLCSYNRKTGEINSYRMGDGLIYDMINSLIEDNNGDIWIGTEKGLSKLSRKINSFKNYGKRNGIPDISFSPNAVFKDNKGHLFLGTLHGILFFNPEKAANTGFDTPVVFTDLKINGRPLNYLSGGEAFMKASLPFSDEISMPFNNGIVTIDFALMDYINVKNNRFSYKLAGLDADWNNIGSRNSATYTNLPPGKYTLLVKAYNDNGWIGKTASLRIQIIPSFYQTLGFKIFLSVIFILFTILVINFRTSTIKKQNLLLEQKVNEHTKYLDRIITDLSQEITERKKAEAKVKASLDEKEILLKEIHHRVKNNLQIISSLLYLQSTKAKDKETLSLFENSQNRIKSMALIHEKLYQSKDFAEINFGEYVNGLVGFLNNSLKNGVNIRTQTNINNIKLDLDTAISCGLIINELVTNSFKYAFPAEFVKNNGSEEFIVGISIIKNIEGTYLLSVYDNGVGIPDGLDIKKAETLGLKLVNSMVKQLDGSIEIKSDKGTVFKISFT
jgi:two-component sensor histidine kinase/ligand-binding sensor domain-containing protein